MSAAFTGISPTTANIVPSISELFTTAASSVSPDSGVSIPQEWMWMVVVGFIVAFMLAFGIGANDVANTFGTIVGAKVLTLYKACAVASVFELLGAILIGSKVSDTIRNGIIDVSPFNGTEEQFLVGNVATLTGSCVWMILATFFSVPVSGTHSIVGATLGFALVSKGAAHIHWMKIVFIIASWIISPLLSGAVSVLIFYIMQRFILLKDDQLTSGLRILPYIYAATILINVFSVFYEGPPLLGFDKIPIWGAFIISLGTGLIALVVVKFAVVPWQRRKIKENCEYIRATEEGDENITEMVEFIPTGANSKSASANQTRASSRHSSRDNTRRESFELQREDETQSGTQTSLEQRALVNNVEVTDDDDGDVTFQCDFREEAETETDISAKPKKRGSVAWKIKSKSSKQSKTEKIKDKKTCVKTPSLLIENKAGKLERERQDYEIVTINRAVQRLKSRALITDTLEARFLFSFLQVLTSVFGGFAHGGNDVSNAIGPLIGLWLVANGGGATHPGHTIWLLCYGGAGIIVGLCVWGRRVIKTMGEDLTKITPSSGFCIEIGSALTVLIASNAGIPISTTHCKVGSIVTVGRFRSRENVDWSLFRNIIFAWIVTLPVSGGISAAVFSALKLIVT